MQSDFANITPVKKLTEVFKIILKYTFYATAGSLLIYLFAIELSKFLAYITNSVPIGRMAGSGVILKREGLLKSFIMLIFWGPVVEEILFRFWLNLRTVTILTSISGILITIGIRATDLAFAESLLISIALFCNCFTILRCFR